MAIGVRLKNKVPHWGYPVKKWWPTRQWRRGGAISFQLLTQMGLCCVTFLFFDSIHVPFPPLMHVPAHASCGRDLRDKKLRPNDKNDRSRFISAHIRSRRENRGCRLNNKLIRGRHSPVKHYPGLPWRASRTIRVMSIHDKCANFLGRPE